jgi:trehalose 6-phosphate phosphatase
MARNREGEVGARSAPKPLLPVTPSVPAPKKHAQTPSEARLPELPANVAFFLDVDGTLLELAEKPDAVRVEPSTLELIRGLNIAARGAVALVSGRSIRDLDRLFAPLVLAAAGQHGMERRDAEGHSHRHAFPSEPLREAAAHLAAFASAHQGLVLEDKGASLALHYRLAPMLEERVREAIEREASALGSNFEIQRGIKVLELKPTGRDKGTAVAEFMREAPFAGRVPVFIGDDLTDEFGFGVVNGLGGISVKVGPAATQAHWRIAHSEGVRRWLEGWTARE